MPILSSSCAANMVRSKSLGNIRASKTAAEKTTTAAKVTTAEKTTAAEKATTETVTIGTETATTEIATTGIETVTTATITTATMTATASVQTSPQKYVGTEMTPPKKQLGTVKFDGTEKTRRKATVQRALNRKRDRVARQKKETAAHNQHNKNSWIISFNCTTTLSVYRRMLSLTPFDSGNHYISWMLISVRKALTIQLCCCTVITTAFSVN
ncbi:hypothetical protein DMN91_000074 [Ooceraea biroi]|uniref:Uncharacterized protein n=1 Tax=Ooceraea biroi TaxID=2015173 RepID=A0A3L8E0N9_OOCBI|nr:hypothetical protein DMN91_000074 [Ooceraea biroi]